MAYLYKNPQFIKTPYSVIITSNDYHSSPKMKRVKDNSSLIQEEDIAKKYIVGNDQDSTLVQKKVKTKKKKKEKSEKKEKQAVSTMEKTKMGNNPYSKNQEQIANKAPPQYINQSKSQFHSKDEKKQKSKKKEHKQTQKLKQKEKSQKKDKIEKNQKVQKIEKIQSYSKKNQIKSTEMNQKYKKQDKKKEKKKKSKSSQRLNSEQKNYNQQINNPNDTLEKQISQKNQSTPQKSEKKKKLKKSKKAKRLHQQIFDQQQQQENYSSFQNSNQRPMQGQLGSQKQVKMQFNDGQSEYSDAKSVSKTGSEKKQKKKNKSESKTKNQSQTINVTNRQMAKQCIGKKSNFYLHKQDLLKQGLPVGRGSRKQQQWIMAERKKMKNQKCRINKQRRKAFLQSRQSSAPSEGISEAAQPPQIPKVDWQQDPLTKYKYNKKGKKDECTKQQSIKIITEFQKDAGDYKCMVKILGFSLVKIRSHLRNLFQYCLTIISSKVIENGMKISDWQILQKREIIRQLHRIRCTNRLLSQQNVQFRQKFIKLMMSYNDPTLKLQNNDYNYLYRKIQAFVRGYCTLGTKKKMQVKNQQNLQMNRPPLLQGGYIMDKNRVKRQVKLEVKMEQKHQEEQQKKIDLQKIIYDWTQQEQRAVSKLYIQNHANFDAIIDQLCLKFGKKNRWKDFQIMGRKIDQLVKQGLYKIQELTSKPYNRQQSYKQQQEKVKNKPKLIDPSTVRSQVNSLDLLTQFIYNNKKVVAKSFDTYENGVFQNPSLLQRQIFGHVESFKVRIALVGLLREKFPTQEQIDSVIKIAQQFMTWAEEWEQKNGVIRVKRKDFVRPKTKGKGSNIRRNESEDSQDKNQQFDQLIFELNEIEKAESERADSKSFYSGAENQQVLQSRLQEEVMRQT